MPPQRLFVFDIETVLDTGTGFNLTGFEEPNPAVQRAELSAGGARCDWHRAANWDSVTAKAGRRD